MKRKSRRIEIHFVENSDDDWNDLWCIVDNEQTLPVFVCTGIKFLFAVTFSLPHALENNNTNGFFLVRLEIFFIQLDFPLFLLFSIYNCFQAEDRLLKYKNKILEANFR